jgi:phosphoserine phosphatase
MNGELDFSESFKQRMALLEGLSEEVLHKVATNLPITKELDACANTMVIKLQYLEDLLILVNICKIRDRLRSMN